MALREIIFRGKLLNNGEWVEGAFFPESDQYPATIFHGRHNSLGDYVDPATVGQFTGLMDRNGNRIFEGDILRCCLGDKIDIGVVQYDDRIAAFIVLFTDGVLTFLDFFTEKVETWYEVIGNIHDNPELLDATSESPWRGGRFQCLG